MTRIDVAIIGGSLAGACCARELSRLGVDAVAFEREPFPREKVCGGFLSPGAVRQLKTMAVLERVRRAGAVDVSSVRVRSRGMEVQLPFSTPGLGVSRHVLDAIVADHPAVQHDAVHAVVRTGGRFRVSLGNSEIVARVVVDAAGKLSRFSAMESGEEFGIQFYENDGRDGVMDFWFFDGGYGGSVAVESKRSNACFLIRKEWISMYRDRPGCRISGPIAYRTRHAPDYLAIGDAGGMVDPFCGEGMHHAMHSGLLAANVIAAGLRHDLSYAEIRHEYETRHLSFWGPRRLIAAAARRALNSRSARALLLRWNMTAVLNRFWNG